MEQNQKDNWDILIERKAIPLKQRIGPTIKPFFRKRIGQINKKSPLSKKSYNVYSNQKIPHIKYVTAYIRGILSPTGFFKDGPAM